jgi:hypothetical protein
VIRFGMLVRVAACAAALSTLPSAFCQIKPDSSVPRTSEGKPDLSGMWNAPVGGAVYDIEPHPAAFGIRASETGIVVGGKIPYQRWAEQQVAKNLADPSDDPEVHCMMPGVPHHLYIGPLLLVQTPKVITFLHEYRHSYRAIYMDRREHLEDYSAWEGDSIGHWDGDTLVVDSIAFNDKTRLDTLGHPHSDQLHVIQRFSRADATHLAYEVTVDDPKAYTKPWTNKRSFTLKPKWELMEYSCEENNKEITEHLVK